MSECTFVVKGQTIHTVKARNFILASKRVISYFKVRYFNMEVMEVTSLLDLKPSGHLWNCNFLNSALA